MARGQQGAQRNDAHLRSANLEAANLQDNVLAKDNFDIRSDQAYALPMLLQSLHRRRTTEGFLHLS